MAFLIDGHNLIGKIPWISLADEDDEGELIKLLQDYARIRRKKVEVFFDQAPAGYSGRRRVGNITAVFVRQGSTADEAIHARLRGLSRSAQNWTVVSSDNLVRRYAKEFRATVIASEEFLVEVKSALQSGSQVAPQTEPGLSEKEVDYWMNLFETGVSGDEQVL